MSYPVDSRDAGNIISRAAENAAADLPTRPQLYELEKAVLENQRLELENKKLAELIARDISDRTLREQYGTRIFYFLVVYSGFCAALLLAQGNPKAEFKLADSVLIALVGSTAVAVVGLVGWIVQGLFRTSATTKPSSTAAPDA